MRIGKTTYTSVGRPLPSLPGTHSRDLTATVMLRSSRFPSAKIGNLAAIATFPFAGRAARRAR